MNKLTLGFTGTRWLDRMPADFATELDNLIREFRSFVSGACVGFDTVAGLRAWRMCQGARHVVVVPADRTRVSGWWVGIDDVEVVRMDPDTTYRDRNIALVKRSDSMIACAEYSEDDPRSTRSGTWQTIRLARSEPIPVAVFVMSSASWSPWSDVL